MTTPWTTTTKELGIHVAAHIVGVDNPKELEIDEDRCRKSRSPWEIYQTGEQYRPALEADARWQKAQGKKLVNAEKKGRVDDPIADQLKSAVGLTASSRRS